MTPEELEEAVSRLLDNDLPKSEFNQLQAYLSASPEARLNYLDLIDTHSLLSLELEERGALPNIPQVVPIDTIRKRQHKKISIIALSATAAALITMAVIMKLFTAEAPVITHLSFKASPSAVISVDDRSMNPNDSSRIKEGSTLSVERGALEIKFESGVRGIIQGPAKLTYTSPESIILDYGKTWFHVPSGAEGFAVSTPRLKIVDLGTKFGVSSNLDSHDEVHVFEGKVQAESHRSSNAPLVLNAGDAAITNKLGEMDVFKARPTSYLTELPDGPLHLHWSFDHFENDSTNVTSSQTMAANISTKLITKEGKAPSSVVTGKYGTGVQFSQTVDKLVTNWQGIKDFDEFTLSFWILLPKQKPHGYSHSVICWQEERGHPTQSKRFYRTGITSKVNSKGQVRLSMVDQHGITTMTQPLPIDTWQHVTVTVKPDPADPAKTLHTFYLNGAAAPATAKHNQTPNKNRIRGGGNPCFSIGTALYRTNSKPQSMKGAIIDEVHVVAEALTLDKIQELMAPAQ